MARRFIEDVWNRGDLALAQRLLAPTLVNHGPVGQTTDAAGFLRFIRATRAALPDIHFTIDDMIAERDKVVTCVTIRAAQNATSAGSPPAGHPEAWSGIGIIRLTDGRIVEQWANTDSIGIALGAFQPQPQ